MELIAQIALGVIIGGLTIALLVMGFFSRQRNDRLALRLFVAGAVIVLVLVVVVARTYLKIADCCRSDINVE